MPCPIRPLVPVDPVKPPSNPLRPRAASESLFSYTDLDASLFSLAKRPCPDPVSSACEQFPVTGIMQCPDIADTVIINYAKPSSCIDTDSGISVLPERPLSPYEDTDPTSYSLESIKDSTLSEHSDCFSDSVPEFLGFSDRILSPSMASSFSPESLRDSFEDAAFEKEASADSLSTSEQISSEDPVILTMDEPSDITFENYLYREVSVNPLQFPENNKNPLEKEVPASPTTLQFPAIGSPTSSTLGIIRDETSMTSQSEPSLENFQHPANDSFLASQSQPSLEKFFEEKEPQLSVITGEKGTGSSTVLHHFLVREDIFERETSFVRTNSFERKTNFVRESSFASRSEPSFEDFEQLERDDDNFASYSQPLLETSHKSGEKLEMDEPNDSVFEEYLYREVSSNPLQYPENDNFVTQSEPTLEDFEHLERDEVFTTVSQPFLENYEFPTSPSFILNYPGSSESIFHHNPTDKEDMLSSRLEPLIKTSEKNTDENLSSQSQPLLENIQPSKQTTVPRPGSNVSLDSSDDDAMFSSCTELLPGIMDTLDENYIVDSFTPSFDTSVITLPPEDQKPLSDEDKSLASRSNNSLDSFQQSNTSLDSFQSGGSDRSATLTRQSKLHVPGLVFNRFCPQER